MLKRAGLISILLVAPLLAIAGGQRAILSLTGPASSTAVTDVLENPAGLTVHEWGTFTSVAGPDGMAMEWLPAGGPVDLPCFVNRLDPESLTKYILSSSLQGKAGEESFTLGRVRMETPVLYFYSPRKETVKVKVSFPTGLMTEWYPAAKVEPSRLLSAQDIAAGTGTIEWSNIQVTPEAAEDFPIESGSSHYYAARKTAAAPLEVDGQHEKFLFYRGIAGFNPPISAQPSPDGKITVTNLGAESIPDVVLFENRAGKIGYRIYRDLRGQMVLDPPDLTGSVDSLGRELEGILQNQGMYPREAQAMVNTWKNTWFEQGSRVFYIVPPRTVDRLLPLEVAPSPVHIARAFVGRMEVVTPATQTEIRNAILKNDQATMETYGRFLEPIVNSLVLSGRISATERSQAFNTIQVLGQEYVKQLSACARKENVFN